MKERGSATSPSTSRSSCRAWPAPSRTWARRAAPGKPGRYNVVYEYREEEVGREAGRIAVALVNHLVAPATRRRVRLRRLSSGLIRLAERRAFGPSTQAIDRRGRLARHPLHPPRPDEPRPARPGHPPAAHPRDDDLAHLGHRGRHRVGQEPHQPLLSSAGLPVPRSQVVRTRGRCGRGCQALGYPVVVKPLDGNHGRGVGLDLRTDEDVRRGLPGRLRREPRR